MTQENKEILLKVLSEQLSYGVLILDTATEKYGKLYQINSDFVWYDCQETGNVECQSIFNVKPYLRPMSSMTEEEKEEFREVIELELKALEEGSGLNVANAAPAAFEIDFYNAHHFDYRGLIEKGLAIEATEGMYKTE